jgi:hypothetical protein
MNPGQRARLNKEKNPHLYCSKCQWKTGGGDCPRHAKSVVETLSDRCGYCGYRINDGDVTQTRASGAVRLHNACGSKWDIEYSKHREEVECL